jgi:hypothetical protein
MLPYGLPMRRPRNSIPELESQFARIQAALQIVGTNPSPDAGAYYDGSRSLRSATRACEPSLQGHVVLDQLSVAGNPVLLG